MPCAIYFPNAVRCSRVEHEGRFCANMEATNPSGWSLGEWITASTLFAAFVTWFIKKPGRFIRDMLQWPGSVREIKDMLKAMQAEIALIGGISRITWKMIDRPIWQSDASGMCVYCNPYALRLLARQDDEFIGNGWLGIVADEDRDMVEKEWSHAMSQNRDMHIRCRLLHKTGEHVHVIMQAGRILSEAGQILGWVWILTVIDK